MNFMKFILKLIIKKTMLHELDNGNILMFDDGRGRPLSEGGEYVKLLNLQLT